MQVCYLVLVLVTHPFVALHLLAKLGLQLPFLGLLGHHAGRTQRGEPVLIPSLKTKETRSP